MEKLFIKQKSIIITMLAFIIPALIMLSIAITGDYAPFGRVSILVADMQYQFVDYIGYLKSVFYWNNDLFYSFSKTFGGDMAGFYAYYLNNPFFYILLFFPNEILPVGIIIMMILICGGCGLTFNIMISGMWGKRFSSLIFSSAYAMMGFMMAYINCIHYFFSIMILPLVILGLYKTVKSRSISLLYVFSAALSIISCYYIGYMILIFTAVFFMFFLFSDVIEFKDFKEQIKVAFIVLGTTLLSVGISAFALFAVVLSLRGQKSSGLQLALSRNFNILEFFSGLYTESFKGNISDGLPLIYSSVIAVVFLLLYFCNSQIKIKEKIMSSALFAFMIAGFWIDALNVAWHGFAHPIGFPYRNSFLFSFLVLFFAYRGFIYVKEDYKIIYANIIVGIFVVYSIYLYFIHSAYVDVKSILTTGMIVVISLILIKYMVTDNKYIVPVVYGLLTLQVGDLYYNGIVSVDAYYEDKNDESVSLETYSNYIEETQTIINTIQQFDNDFYRIDKLYRRTHNDPMMFSYNGLSHFSSCETDQVKQFMGRLGFRNNGNWAYYGPGSTTLSDCIMGLKYVLSQYDEISKPYDMLSMYNDKYIFYNPYALKLGFGMDKSVKNLNMEENDLFKLQNNIASSFTGTRYEIYSPVKISDIRTMNVTKDGNIYRRNNSSEEAYVEYELNITSNDFIYMYFDAPEVQDVKITVNDMEKQAYFTLYDWCIRECGYFDPGSKINVRLTLNQDEIEIDDYKFYYEKTNILKAWYKEASKTECNIEKISSSHLIANVNLAKDEEYIAFSIPYEKDWIVSVDGKRVEPVKIMDALMAIEMNEGEHQIEMQYIPRGIIYGMPISVVCFITTFCVVFLKKRKKIQG